MRHRLYIVVLAALLALAVWAPGASAVFQKQRLVATPKAQTWESKVIRGTIYAHIYQDDREIAQQWIGGCQATYPNRRTGLMVWLVVRNCTKDGPGTYRLRYTSFRGEQAFTVRLTRIPSSFS